MDSRRKSNGKHSKDKKPKDKHSKDKQLHGKKSNGKISRSDRDYRRLTDKRDNYPNGYVEDCTVQHRPETTVNHKPDFPPSTFRYLPTSVILSTTSNLILTAETAYDIHFSTGIAEGGGVTINEAGNIITFLEEGSYRFEIGGEAAPFSDVTVKLVFSSDKFTEDLLPFTETIVPKDEGKLLLRGIATILPIQKDQTVITRLIPDPDESIALLANTRLLIHRVA